MHQSVRNIWVAFNKPLEGVVRSLYADVLGLVTTGMGNLLDATDKSGKPLPIDVAWRLVKDQVRALPWHLPGNIRPTNAQVEAAWRAVRADPNSAKRGWKYAEQIPANNIRLDMVDVEALILSKLSGNDSHLLARFADWESRPAAAQLAVHSMAWAMGPGFFFKFPKFTTAFRAADYHGAAAECDISPAHGTIGERNRRNRKLLAAAATSADPESLIWTPSS